MKQLIISATGAMVEVGKAYKILNGVNSTKKGENTLKIDDIIPPNEDIPEGRIITNVSNSGGMKSWSEYSPSVIGAEFIE